MSRRKVKKGDILFTTEAPCGNSALATRENIALAKRVIKFRTNENKINNLFLLYHFQSIKFTKYISRTVFGSTVSGISKKDFSKHSIKVPSLISQNQIGVSLSQIDNLIISPKKEINNYRVLKITLINNLFTFKPYDKIIKLSSIGSIVTGKTPSTKNLEDWIAEVPFITPTDMNLKKYISTSRYVSQLHISEKILLPPDSICFTCIASIGKMCMTSELSITNQQINSVVLNKNYNSHYVYYQFQWLKKKDKVNG